MTKPSTSKTLATKIGTMIAKKRKASHLTQAELAERLEISVDAMSKMERGLIMPSVSRLNTLAEILNCETSEFLVESSPVLSDQTKRLAKLLSQLSEAERERFIQIAEQMVKWKNQDT